MNKEDIETIINYNRGEENASVFTYDPTLQRHMENRLHAQPFQDYGKHGKEYLVSKKWIPKPRMPRQRVMTDEQRENASARLKKARENKKIGSK
jgi:hypothetical protein